MNKRNREFDIEFGSISEDEIINNSSLDEEDQNKLDQLKLQIDDM